MYYNTPNINKYLEKLLKYRKLIILFFTFLTLFSIVFIQPKFVSSDELFWLQDSQELHKTHQKHYDTFQQSKLVVHVKQFNDQTLSKLKTLNKTLEKLPNVLKVSSIFSNDFIENQSDTNSSNMIVVLNSKDINSLQIKQLVKKTHNNYCNVVDSQFKTFYFFINSSSKLNLSNITIPGEYQYIDQTQEIDRNELFFYGLLFGIILIVLFRLLFKNYIAAFSGIYIVFISTTLTFSIIVLITGINVIYMTMPFITISISLVEFLYFYYRWHVSQYKTHELGALKKMLNRNMTPAMWTSILTLLGLGSLVFVNSDIIKLLSMSVIISSIMSYVLNLTLLPAILSFFTLKHTHVPYAKLGFLLGSNELHYNKKFLFIFLSITYALALFGATLIYSKAHNFFSLQVKNEQIELKIPYKQINLEFIESLDHFTKDLQDQFKDGLGDVVSIVKLVKSINKVNTQTGALDNQALLQALFYIDLYKLNDKYFDDNAVNITINLFDMDKVELLNWLNHYKKIQLYFLNDDALSSIAKYNKTLLLATSLFFALVIIGIITGWIFRSIPMAFVGFTVNVIPILWFGVLITLFDIPLSMEMLIAMTISVGLASDATIHFAYKYFRLRYFGRSQKHTLEKLFFYAGIPVIIGSIFLIIVFASLWFSQIESLQLIGLYSALLISISLVSDLFILPVMLLSVDRFEHLKKSS